MSISESPTSAVDSECSAAEFETVVAASEIGIVLAPADAGSPSQISHADALIPAQSRDVDVLLPSSAFDSVGLTAIE